MEGIITKCFRCQKEFLDDSENFYWHLKIHKAIDELISQEDIRIEPDICVECYKVTSGKCPKHSQVRI